jgi:hypothetical protein
MNSSLGSWLPSSCTWVEQLTLYAMVDIDLLHHNPSALDLEELASPLRSVGPDSCCSLIAPTAQLAINTIARQALSQAYCIAVVNNVVMSSDCASYQRVVLANHMLVLSQSNG